MISVRVDFNSRGRDGLVKASQRRAQEPVHVGDHVLAVDPDEGMSFDARVAEVDDDTGRILLEVDWEQTTPTGRARGSSVSLVHPRARG
ncbi:MAG TPA: hypothetical protein VFD59_03990 [Nocardioidaceae bacterium]|nr:hypothetical protein [Nocardioidaceae bacterium]